MGVITVSSLFGTGGSVVGSMIGKALGWPVVNRAIPVEVARILDLPVEVVLAKDESLAARLWQIMDRAGTLLIAEGGNGVPREAFMLDNAFRVATENAIKTLVGQSDAVIIGRAAAIILGSRTDALHVRLGGPKLARLRQGMSALGLSESIARKQQAQVDRARRAYVRRFYGRDWDDPTLYHLVIDSTALPLANCVRLVLIAAEGRGILTDANAIEVG